MTIYIASHNEKKIKEIQTYAKELTIQSYQTLSSEKIKVEETGATYAANAKLKAETIGSKLKVPVIGDDGGLELLAKPNILGVHTSRFFEKGASDSAMNQKILALLENESDRRFVLKATLAYYVPHQELILVERELNGTIAREERGSEGYGFDTLLIPEGYQITLAELSEKQRAEFSPRIQAFKELLGRISRHVS
ncbi:non-canonical purine NTP pyrophosphatase [Vagococcus sp.]|uniref:non-canonical purine NTP pyrophosphatase n=1 Tax=Vagococcus sp. TaxID=1933889 RepID=UPI003F986AF7